MCVCVCVCVCVICMGLVAFAAVPTFSCILILVLLNVPCLQKRMELFHARIFEIPLVSSCPRVSTVRTLRWLILIPMPVPISYYLAMFIIVFFFYSQQLFNPVTYETMFCPCSTKSYLISEVVILFSILDQDTQRYSCLLYTSRCV